MRKSPRNRVSDLSRKYLDDMDVGNKIRGAPSLCCRWRCGLDRESKAARLA